MQTCSLIVSPAGRQPAARTDCQPSPISRRRCPSPSQTPSPRPRGTPRPITAENEAGEQRDCGRGSGVTTEAELSLSKLMVQGGGAAPRGQQRGPRWTTLAPPPGRHQGVLEVSLIWGWREGGERANGGGVIYGELTARDTISRGHTPLAAKA